MLYRKKYSEDSEGNKRVEALFNSSEDLSKPSNTPKSIYYLDKGILFVYFIRERLNKKGRKPESAKPNELFLNGRIYTGSVYEMYNMTPKKYTNFESAASQGRYYRTYVSKDETIRIGGKFNLLPSEILEVLESFSI